MSLPPPRPARREIIRPTVRAALIEATRARTAPFIAQKRRAVKKLEPHRPVAGENVGLGDEVLFWEDDDRAVRMLVVDVFEPDSASTALGLFSLEGPAVRFIPCAPATRDGTTRRGRWSPVAEPPGKRPMPEEE